MDGKLPPPLKKRKLYDTNHASVADQSSQNTSNTPIESKDSSRHTHTQEKQISNTPQGPKVSETEAVATALAALEPQQTMATFTTSSESHTAFHEAVSGSPGNIVSASSPNATKESNSLGAIRALDQAPASAAAPASKNVSPAAVADLSSLAAAVPNHMEENSRMPHSPGRIAAEHADDEHSHEPMSPSHDKQHHSDHLKHPSSSASNHHHHLSPSHAHGLNYQAYSAREASSHYDDYSEDEAYHPEHIRLRSAGVAQYEDAEIDALWDRLTKNNQKLMFKQFLRRNPEHIGQLYVIADRESNVTEHIATKFSRIGNKMERAIQPNVLSWNDLEDTNKTKETLAEYRVSLESRTENPDLDRLTKSLVDFVVSYLDIASSYIQRGKFTSALLIVATLVAKFGASRACTENYLKAEEEKQLADKFVRVAQRFLDNEYPPRGIGSSLFSHIYEFGDKIMSDDVRQAFFTKLKDLGAPNVPLQSNTTATVDSSSKSTSGASDQVPQSMEPRQQEDVMMTD